MKKIILGAAILASSTLVNAAYVPGEVTHVRFINGLDGEVITCTGQGGKCISYQGLFLTPGKEVIIHYPGGDVKGTVMSQSSEANDEGNIQTVFSVFY